jgi:hypothetical protein
MTYRELDSWLSDIFEDVAIYLKRGQARSSERGCLASVLQEAQKTRVFTPVRESSGESRFNLRAIAANISELLGSLDKPLLAELPFLVGC